MMIARRCSHCGHNGHNSRTCPNRGIRLFGVRLGGGGVIRKSASTSNLNGGIEQSESVDGYASDGGLHGGGRGIVQNSGAMDRKKGVPWSEEEHRLFLLGLRKLGKGDWRGISRTFVTSRTPTQVASHAQKYFIRQNNVSKRKRRSSLFDITQDHQEPFLDPSKVMPPPPPPPPLPQPTFFPLVKPTATIAGDASELTRLSLGNASFASAAAPPPPQAPPPLAPSRISAFHGIRVSG